MVRYPYYINKFLKCYVKRYADEYFDIEYEVCYNGGAAYNLCLIETITDKFGGCIEPQQKELTLDEFIKSNWINLLDFVIFLNRIKKKWKLK